MNWDDLMNSHLGETCVIIGNGPSLKEIPLEFLGKYPTFGTNRIYLLEGFTPTYYVAVNPLVVEQSLGPINALQSKAKFITAGQSKKVEGSLPLGSMPVPYFSPRPDQFVYEGFTVTYVCMQLAYFMGFKTVLLVGVDHAYTFKGKPNEEKVAEGPDLNHFSPAYFSGGVKWNNPDLKRSEEAYQIAWRTFTADGRAIVNLTPGTKLEVFPKMNWWDFSGGQVVNLPNWKPIPLKAYELITAITSAYYTRGFLPGRIDNLLAQSIQPQVIIVCHEGSPEYKIGSSYVQEGVVVISLPEGSPVPTVYGAWNLGVHAASSRYLTNANADDRLLPGALERVVDALEENPGYSVGYFNIGITEHLDSPPVNFFTWAEGGLPELLKGCFLGPMPVWKADLHNTYGLFDETFQVAGDYEFWLRLARGKEKFLHLEEVLGLYLKRKDGRELREPIRTTWETARAKALYR